MDVRVQSIFFRDVATCPQGYALTQCTIPIRQPEPATGNAAVS